MVAIKIATFNCKNLSTNNPGKIHNIATTIKFADPDICVIQEINNLEALPDLINSLGSSEWSEIHHAIPINTNNVPEFMAFIFKSSDIDAIGCFTFTQQEKSQFVGQGKVNLRAPVFARFILTQQKHQTDIVIISYHTNEKNPMYDCMRIKQHIRAIKASNKECKHIIFLGDFNTHANDEQAFGKVSKRGWIPTLNFNQPTNFANTAQYDNIWYHPSQLYIKQPAKVFRECIHPDTIPQNYSDHCLVQAELYFIKPTLSKHAQLFNPPNMTKALQTKSARMLNFRMCFRGRVYVDCRGESMFE